MSPTKKPKEPKSVDPNALKREAAGRYSTPDGRFEVDDPCLPRLLARLDVFFHDVDFGDHCPILLGENLADLATFAALAALKTKPDGT